MVNALTGAVAGVSDFRSASAGRAPVSAYAALACLLAMAAAACQSKATMSGSSPASAAVTSWTQFQDPLEQAFTADVPSGWTAKGGLFRLGYSDTRAMIDLVSPDGQTHIRFGDVAVPTYFVPNANHSQEGSNYDLGAQAQLTVAKYVTGQEFAARYARTRFKPLCTSLDNENDVPAAVQPYPYRDTVSALSGVTPEQVSEGQAQFNCGGAISATAAALGPSPMAYVYAKTTLYQGMWQVPALASYLTPPDRAAEARNIINHVTTTLKISPAWIERQKQEDAEALLYQHQRQQARLRQLTQQVAQAEASMQSMQNQVKAFEAGQAQKDAQVQGFLNVLNGITPTTDPMGNEHDVWTGPKNSYWINGLGQTVNSDRSPGPGWQPLTVNH